MPKKHKFFFKFQNWREVQKSYVNIWMGNITRTWLVFCKSINIWMLIKIGSCLIMVLPLNDSQSSFNYLDSNETLCPFKKWFWFWKHDLAAPLYSVVILVQVILGIISYSLSAIWNIFIFRYCIKPLISGSIYSKLPSNL